MPSGDGQGNKQKTSRYWGWRFEAEIARAWQTARNDNQDHDDFGGRGLARQIGDMAFREARELLEQDQRVVLDLDDDTLCRQFVGFVTYLRYFAPGTRAYFFPAMGDSCTGAGGRQAGAMGCFRCRSFPIVREVAGAE